ncbi:MAG: thiamine pyrophosphate-binding protein [SAR324 cluster bacterium]|nr:thiamine pyrophosphate-binding protein [SAR324 cluster bacterium]
MPVMTGGQAVVKSLIGNGITTLFALPGVQNDPLFIALYDAGAAVRVIHTRHEQGAAYMALGYAAATGGMGAYAVVPGPGFLNTTAALSTAYATNSKVLCLTGQITSSAVGRGYGLLHEIPDQMRVLRSLTKWAESIPSPAAAPGLVAEAIRQMYTGRPRPVGLEMAMDIMAREEDVQLLPPETEFARPPVNGDAIREAAKILGQAQSPLIFAGGGAMDAVEELAGIAEMLQAPVITTRSGRGAMSSRHYLSHTMPVGHQLWAGADAVLAIGTRLQIPQMNWGLDGDLKMVRVDIDPEEHDRVAPPAVGIVADCRDALRALIDELGAHNRKRSNREEELTALRQAKEAEFASLEPQMSYLKVIREELPDDGIFVDELTQIGYVSRFALPVYQPRTFLSTGYQGTLGWGVATALGVKLAQPGKPVLLISGDGGFMFNAQELATAVQHQIGVVMLVFNDDAYGNVLRMQKELYDNRVIASQLHNPDFVKLADAFGAQGLRANSPQELRDAIRQGFAAKGPTVIDVPVGEMPAPWHNIVMPQVRGKGAKG